MTERLQSFIESINSKQKVFVYGTLKNPKTRKEAIGVEIPTKPASITGEIKEDENYSTIVEGEGMVDGQVMELTNNQLKKLDIWESEYIRHMVTMTTGESCWAYSRRPEFGSDGKRK